MKKQLMAVLSAAAIAAATAGAYAPAALADEGTDNFNAEGFPIVNEPMELNVMIIVRDNDSFVDFDDMPVVQALEEETGIHVNWNIIKAADADTQLNLMFASGDYPDCIIDDQAKVDYEEYGVTQGILIPLDDYIAKYMTTYNKRSEAEDTDPRVSLIASDGKTYSVGHLFAQNSNMSECTFINQAWLDNLGLQMPTNVDELTDVLRAFRDEDADGDGDTDDEVPYEMGLTAGGYSYIRSALPMFGIPASTNRWIYIDNDKKVQFAPTQEGFRKCMEWLNLCYTENLLDPDVMSIDGTTIDTKYQEDNQGYWSGWRLSAMGWDDGVGKVGTLYIPHDEGACFETNLEVASPTGFVTIAAEEKGIVPQVMRWMDAQMDTEMMFDEYYGMKTDGPTDTGEGWWYDADNGKISVGVDNTIPTMEWLGVNALFYGPAKYIDETYNQPSHRQEKTGYCEQLAEAGVQQKYSNTYLTLAPLTSDQQSTATLMETDINSAVNEHVADFVTNGVTDDSWNEFVSLFDGMGVADYVQLYQNALDTMDIE